MSIGTKFLLTSRSLPFICCKTFNRNAATQKAVPEIASLGKKSKLTEPMINLRDTVVLPVEKDTEKLRTYVCGTNLLKEGGEDIKVKDDSAYPDWLWTLRTSKLPPLEELDPNTKDYWRQVRIMARQRAARIKVFRPHNSYLPGYGPLTNNHVFRQHQFIYV